MRKFMFSVFRLIIEILSGKAHRFQGVYRGLYFLCEHLRPKSILLEFRGNKMYVDPAISEPSIFTNKAYVKFTMELIEKLIKKGMIVLDLGAHIGYYTLIAAKLVGENGRVFSFEPEPYNFALLSKNVEINGYENVVLIKKAVLDKTGRCDLFFDIRGSWDASVLKCDRPRSIRVETTALDDFFQNTDYKIDVIKMNIEGAEPLALLGADRIIKANKSLKIFTEFSPRLLKRCGFLPEEYLKMLTERNFKIYNINGDKRILELINCNELKNFVQRYSTNERCIATNLLCIKEPIEVVVT